MVLGSVFSMVLGSVFSARHAVNATAAAANRTIALQMNGRASLYV
jgi:hypothetical protein